VLRGAAVCSIALTLALACGPREEARPLVPSAPAASGGAAGEAPRVVSIVGTNDLHGRVYALPLLAGYVDNLRRARAADGGGVLLLDGGDMFQGTLESNLLEGTSVRDAYAALGYDAVAIGNHEFDYGPRGPSTTPKTSADDARGALRALAEGAPFPFLLANVVHEDTGKRPDWKNVLASTKVVVAGIPIGLVGITTEDLLHTTIVSNVSDLAVAPAAAVVEREADALRQSGARAVIVLAHAGSHCKAFTNDVEADSCAKDEEVFRLAAALPEGTVDVIVAGHTHAGVAHDVNGIAIIEQYAYGRAFGRVDLTFSGSPVELVSHEIFAPHDLCPGQAKPDFAACTPADYESAAVVRSAKVEAAIAAGVHAAKDRRVAPVGVELEGVIARAYQHESPLGNLFADLILDGAPGADAALMNGGGLRDDLPAGPLHYGALFEAFPFDNLVGTARIAAGDLERLLAAHFERDGGGILSIAGLSVSARCDGATLTVELRRGGSSKPLADDEPLLIAASDFMLLGGDGFWGPLSPPPLTIGDELMRDIFERGLAKRKRLAARDVYDAAKPRLELAEPRPIRCP
jgi:5'-nucleotidase